MSGEEVMAQSTLRFAFAVLLTLGFAAPALAETKLFVRLDPEAAGDLRLAIRLRSKDSRGQEIARSAAGARQWLLVDASAQAGGLAVASALREYCVEVVKGEKVVQRLKLSFDAQQAAQYLGHEPSTLRELPASERGSIYLTI